MAVTKQSMILVTKLHSPPVTANLVPRPQLYARLDSGLQYPLTLVSAPAGFGKSTLLSAWLAQSDMRFAWLSLDAGDNDLTVFLSYFIAAVRSLYAGACAETEAMIRLASLPESAVLAHQLINELETLPGAFVLVLDDFHTIRDRAIQKLVATIVRRPPRPLHLVLAGREDPSLPLAKLRAQGHMLEFRSADLRFRRAETVAFLRQIPDLTIDEAGVTILDAAVEGWPAGLRLATLSLRLSGDLAGRLSDLSRWSRVRSGLPIPRDPNQSVWRSAGMASEDRHCRQLLCNVVRCAVRATRRRRNMARRTSIHPMAAGY